MKIKGAIFDMDGTLINSLWCWDELWEWGGRTYLGVEGFRPAPEFDKAVRTMVLADAMDYIHEKCGIAGSGKEILDHFNAILPELYWTKIPMKEGAREFLDYCLEQNIPMVLASATESKLIEIALEKHGLSKYFKSVLSCAVIGKGKEHPDIFEAALEQLGTPREETWVFEDSYVALETAAAIGMPTVGVFDRYAFEHERLEKSATHYIDDGETLMKLVPFEK
jgi:HAD superfamily hydrolase (TIGR01509 family)